MAYVSYTSATHTKWWITGTGSSVNRLSEIMDDQADGPFFRIASGGANWTAGSGSEYYNTPSKQPDHLYDDGVKLTAVADDSQGSLNAGEWCWDTTNSRVYARLSDNSDPDNSNMDLYYDWNNGNSGTDFMTEHVEDRVYEIHLLLEIGNGSTSTTLESYGEIIRFTTTDHSFRIRPQATFQCGELDGNGNGKHGSYVEITLENSESDGSYDDATAIFKFYGSTLAYVPIGRRYIQFRGFCDVQNSMFTTAYWADQPTYQGGFSFYRSAASWSPDNPTKIHNTIFADCYTVYWYNAIDSDGCLFFNTQRIFANVMNCELWNANISGVEDINLAVNNEPSLQIIDPVGGHVNNIGSISAEDSVISEDYTCNFTIVDKNATAIQNATIKIEDDSNNVVGGEEVTNLYQSITATPTEFYVVDASGISVGDIIRIHQEYIYVGGKTGNKLTNVTRGYYGSPYFAVEHRVWSRLFLVNQNGEDTNASGNTPQQILPYRIWKGTAKTEYNPNPYKITISKTGYETLTLENITIDSKINWHLELQPQLPHESEVKHGVTYGDNRVGQLMGAGPPKKKHNPGQDDALVMSIIKMFLQDK